MKDILPSVTSKTRDPIPVSPQVFAKIWARRRWIGSLMGPLCLTAMFMGLFYVGWTISLEFLFMFVFAGGGLGGYVLFMTFQRLFYPMALPPIPLHPWKLQLERDKITVSSHRIRTTFLIDEIEQCKFCVDQYWDGMRGIEDSYLWIQLRGSVPLKIGSSSENFYPLRDRLCRLPFYEHIEV